MVLHRVVSHRIHVFVRHDFRSARFDQPELVGVLRYQRTAIAVDRSQGSWWRGFVAVVALGVEHIEGGTDHLLFLLVLLLPVVLRPTAGRHDEPAGARASALAILKVVTAFTLGHSLTLALAATGVVTVASRPVEVLIAVSILVSAVHAVRPLFPRREAWIAAGFGLVHGLAFADRLAGVGYDGASLVLGILGFNLGIEAMQLLIVVVVAPSLVVLSTTRIYPVVRWGGPSWPASARWAGGLSARWGCPTPSASGSTARWTTAGGSRPPSAGSPSGGSPRAGGYAVRYSERARHGPARAARRSDGRGRHHHRRGGLGVIARRRERTVSAGQRSPRPARSRCTASRGGSCR